jgi:hypothetical protein
VLLLLLLLLLLLCLSLSHFVYGCRLITSDAFAAVRRSYLLRQLARQPVHDEEQQQQG